MLSYPLEEASTLLHGKLIGAQTTLKTLVEDLEFLKEQITVMEVNTARVFNFDVKRFVPSSPLLFRRGFRGLMGGGRRRERKAREEKEGSSVLASKKDREEDEKTR